MLLYLPTAVWAWMKATARYVLTPKHPFPGPDCAPRNSHYPVPNSLNVSIAGDWGTGTEEAHAVATEMMKWDGGGEPDLTIHIGDIYYVGGNSEVRQNCLDGDGLFPKNESVQWPAGRLGTFALNGNHEMLARGIGYFDLFLPTLGMKNEKPKGQGTSFFCLENDYWRIVAIDTAYNSTSMLFKPDCKLPDPIISWLSGIVPKDDRKATILISHQQYFSGFEGNYPVPARQLSQFFKKWPVLWFWGHEHRSSAYGLHQLPGVELSAYGRCLGHGGMPVETNPPSTKAENVGPAGKLLFVDRRINPFYADGQEDPPLGMNGFAHVLFDGPSLTVQHKSLVCGSHGPQGPWYPSSTTLLTETFTCDGPEIKWHGFRTPIPQIQGFDVYPNGKDGKCGPVSPASDGVKGANLYEHAR
jgi:hypothetical protein